ncbi:MAG: hypothetical protein KKA99_03665 [Gammaproteobacteria bacterium]|nr:hypothetical protein [Gammaproteobacteria bacterium]MBU1730167.1 hypothetical protein [Patescibacteria group bacterium]MBU1956119.1 hypothetical protein [Patescibacteria group bacterium]
MTPIKFEELKPRITDAIQAKLRQTPVLGENGFTIVEGFIMQPISNEMSGNIIIGGPSIPLVAIVGNTSGRMYYFALKALLPDISI